MNLNNRQVDLVIGKTEREQVRYLENPYLLYEDFRAGNTGFSVGLIDKAVFTDFKSVVRFHLPEKTAVTDRLDERRIRGVAVQILEEAATEGNTLLTGNQLVTKLDKQPLEPLCDPSQRNLIAIAEFLKSEVVHFTLDAESDLYYFKLKRYDEIKDKIKKFVQKRSKSPIPVTTEKSWEDLINEHIEAVGAEKPNWYKNGMLPPGQKKQLRLK